MTATVLRLFWFPPVVEELLYSKFYLFVVWIRTNICQVVSGRLASNGFLGCSIPAFLS